MAKDFINKRTGNVVRYLNGAEKGRKYAFELRHNKKQTNLGLRKRDKNGKTMTLTKQARAYRSGYLQARKDNAYVYKLKHRRK